MADTENLDIHIPVRKSLSNTSYVNPTFKLLLQHSTGKSYRRTYNIIAAISIATIVVVLIAAAPFLVKLSNSTSKSSKDSAESLRSAVGKSSEVEGDTIILLLGSKMVSGNQTTTNIKTFGTRDGCPRVPNLFDFNTTNGIRVSGITNRDNGSIVTCSTHVNTTGNLECRTYDPTKKEWKGAALKNSALLDWEKESQGFIVNEYLMFHLNNGTRFAYDSLMKKFLELKYPGHVNNFKGSCSTHYESNKFFQVGGFYGNERNPLINMFLLNLEASSGILLNVSQDNSPIPDINVRRKMPGCTVVKLKSFQALVVAGGTNYGGKVIQSIEYLPIGGNREKAWKTIECQFPSFAIIRPYLIFFGGKNLKKADKQKKGPSCPVVGTLSSHVMCPNTNTSLSTQLEYFYETGKNCWDGQTVNFTEIDVSNYATAFVSKEWCGRY